MTTYKGPDDEQDLGKMILFTHIDQAEKALLYKDYQNTIYHAMQILYLIKKKNLNELAMPRDYAQLLPLMDSLASLPLIENTFEIRYEETNAMSLILQSLVAMKYENIALSLISEYYKSAPLIPFAIRQLEVKLLMLLHLYEQAESRAAALKNDLNQYSEEDDGVLEKQTKVASLIQSVIHRKNEAAKSPNYEPVKAIPIEETIIEEKVAPPVTMAPTVAVQPLAQKTSTPAKPDFWQTLRRYWTQDGATSAYSLFALVALVFMIYKLAKSNSGQRFWHSMLSLIKAAFTFV